MMAVQPETSTQQTDGRRDTLRRMVRLPGWGRLSSARLPLPRSRRLRLRLRPRRPAWLRLPLDKDDRRLAAIGLILAALFGVGLPYGTTVIGLALGLAVRAFMFGAGW